MQYKLKNHFLFNMVDNKQLENLINSGQVYIKKIKKGGLAIKAEDKCEYLDIVSCGELVAYLANENGYELSMFHFTKDRVIGGNLLFSTYNTYPLNIYCLSDCELIRIKKVGVQELVANPFFAMAFIRMLSENSWMLNQKMIGFSCKSLRENLTEYLKAESIKQNSKRIILPFSKKQLADLLGVQRQSLFRELKKMRDENLIDYNAKEIILLEQ